ncbi:MAG: penicillin-binding protein activator [Burkholderiales bacterium]|nr:penicillin-binding protein activator [Burkholderiales bacterium]
MASDAVTPAAAATTAQVPHIALLLPLESKVFARHAIAVRDGFRAAAGVEDRPLLPVREYAVSGDVGGNLEGFRAAVAAGAQVVVGPLTRDAVTALAFGEPVPVPTLALNMPDDTGRMPGNLYVLGLQVETEARQVARLVWEAGRRTAATISGSGPVQRRMQAAFAAEFRRAGGSITTDIPFVSAPEKLRGAARSLNAVDSVFLALDHAEARSVRPYLGNVPLYATSSVHGGDLGPLAGHDLAGIHFIDMPWLLEPEHPRIAAYPRSKTPVSAELDRLYALGIDAWRIARLLLEGTRDIRLNGVTGRLVLGADGLIERELVAGRYADGRAQALLPGQREPAR